ncbi:hypothetical protein [Chitinimonas sp.]|uniref:hypothetical protein n=1 Tax=Chitinimonas sp. TaxID=1934313 RepID=UPI0035AF8A39
MARLARQQAGFILLYVLAVMVVLSGLALSVAYRERVGVQLVHNVVDTTHDEYTLRSAVALCRAQLALAAQLEPLLKVQDASAKGVDVWQAGDERMVTIGESQVRIRLTAGAVSPDFNLFDEQELTRLFGAMGIDADKAKLHAKAVLAAKPADGFADREALRQISDLPSAVLLGAGKEGKEGKEGGGPSLVELVDVGSKSKRIDLDKTPLEVVAALGNLKPEQLIKLQRLRLAGPVNKEQALQTVGAELGKLLEGSESMLATLKIEGSDSWADVQLQRNGNTWNSSAFKLRRGQPEPNKQEEDAG